MLHNIDRSTVGHLTDEEKAFRDDFTNAYKTFLVNYLEENIPDCKMRKLAIVHFCVEKLSGEFKEIFLQQMLLAAKTFNIDLNEGNDAIDKLLNEGRFIF